MTTNPDARLQTEALVVGYAMSRLDRQYLMIRGFATWNDAFANASEVLSVKATSVKLIRDEFDPFFPNPRKGWHNREILPSRQRILSELRDISDDGLAAIVDRILHQDHDSVIDAIDSLADVSRTTASVAERLLTGRKAEDFFLENAETIARVPRADLVDARLLASGYDFGVRTDPKRVFEVKGLKGPSGNLLFTDREWSEARIRNQAYCLVVIANLAETPFARLITDPRSELTAKSECRTTVAVSWRVPFAA